jgi:hypothetical protein
MLFAKNSPSFRTQDSVRALTFASGVNRLAEMRGFARLGLPFGASAAELNDEAIYFLESLQQPVLIDSGAFSEVVFGPKGATVVQPIAAHNWRRRLAIYLRLGRALGTNAFVVAPDRVGDQVETLRRLDAYKCELKAIAATGAQVLIPLQVGELSNPEFFHAANRAAGISMVPAMPMKKKATEIDALVSFVRQVTPPAMHLLGIGITQRKGQELLKILTHFLPDAQISLDSNRLRAVIGQNRPLTVAERKLRAEPVDGCFSEVDSTALSAAGERVDYTDLIASPSLWADPAALRAIAALLPSARAMQEFAANPDLFLQQDEPDTELAWIENPLIAAELDRQWLRFVERSVAKSIRTAAIIEVFGDSSLTLPTQDQASDY